MVGDMTVLRVFSQDAYADVSGPRLTADESELLLLRFAIDAYKSYPGAGSKMLTTLRPADVIERMHDVFGHGNFVIEPKSAEFDTETGVLAVSGTVSIYHREGGLRFRYTWMGFEHVSNVKKIQDDFKGAVTNAAVSKSLFWNLLVGLDMFKGKVTVDGGGNVTFEESVEELNEIAIKAQRKRVSDWVGSDTDRREVVHNLVAEVAADRQLDVTKMSELKSEEFLDFYSRWRKKQGGK